ncbi:MAG: thioredoxin family protein [Bacteroidales bacterium]|nr:thioredoxin family protein [Bacteroidales bacterium]
MELQTRLGHIHSEGEFNTVIGENQNVMICCGRMGPMCVPVYAAMEILGNQYPGIAFYDMPFDHPEAHVIRNLPDCKGFMGLPFTVYFKNGKVVKATSSIQTQEQVESILKEFF